MGIRRESYRERGNNVSFEVKHKLEEENFRRKMGKYDIKIHRKELKNYCLLAIANPCADFFLPCLRFWYC